MPPSAAVDRALQQHPIHPWPEAMVCATTNIVDEVLPLVCLSFPANSGYLYYYNEMAFLEL